MAKKKTTFELTISIRNKNPRKLIQIRDWIDSQLSEWWGAEERPMRGTDWDRPTELQKVEDDWNG